MPEPLPNSAGDIAPDPASEPETTPQTQQGRVLRMKSQTASDDVTETLDDRISEVIHDVQNGSRNRFNGRIAEPLRQLRDAAQQASTDVASWIRRMSREKPLHLVGAIAAISFLLGATLRATRSRYE